MTETAGTKKVHVVTGNSECINNLYLAVCLEQYFQGLHFVFIDEEAPADVLILNVCNVLKETPQFVQKYREVARANPRKQVLVLGCVPASLVPPDAEENFHVIPYGQLARNPGAIGPKMGFGATFSFLKADQVFSELLPNARVPFPPEECCYITIGSGCEGRCTYCSIRAGRGAARSVAPDVIVADAKAGVAKGRFRLVLIHDDAGCWGHDLGLDLPHLLRRLREACPTARFVLLDFNPRNLPIIFEGLRPFLPAIDFIYMPMQSGNDRILGMMDRQYQVGDILGLIREMKAQNPAMVMETDLIVGFPSETRAEFRDSLEVAKLFDSAAFVPFVPKNDTPAVKLPGRLDAEEMRQRIEEVRQAGLARRFKPIDTSYSGSGHGGVGKVSLIIERERRKDVLQRPTQICLSRHATVDLVAGCPLECVYCDQEFAPGSGARSIILWADTLKQLVRELDARKTPPQLVYFSSHCDPFVPEPRVLDLLHQAMRLVLERGAFVLVETRNDVPEQFLSLFAECPDRVKVQIGLSTADDRVRELMEPNAASVARRIASVKALVTRGVPLEVGVGPLAPGLDDSGSALADLLTEFARAGATRGNVSFLHLADASRRRMQALTFGSWSFAEMAERLYTRQDADCTGATVWRAEAGYRDWKWGEVAALGKSLGIDLRLCRCNNPDRLAPSPDDSPLTRGPGISLKPTRAKPAARAGAKAAHAGGKRPTPAKGAARGAPPAPADAETDALLDFVTAGTDLRARPSGGPGAGTGGAPGATDDGHGLEGASHAESAAGGGSGGPAGISVPVGPGGDDPAAWRAISAGAAAESPTLLPAHAPVLRELLRWLGRNGFTGEALLSPEAVRVEIPDEGQGGGMACVEITLHAPGQPCFKRAGEFGVSYRGRFSPVVKLVTERIVKFLSRG